MLNHLVSTYVQGRVGSIRENDIFAGGLMLLLVGVIGAYIHTFVQLISDRIKREFVVSIEVRKEDEAFQWLMKWLAHHTDSSNGRELSVLTVRDNRRDRWEGAEAANRP